RPPPVRISMIVSERLGPLVLAPGSLLVFWRRSEPSTRMLLADVSGNDAESSTRATLEGGEARSKCELSRNSSSDSASQPTSSESRPTTTRFGVILRLHGASSSPAPPGGLSELPSRQGSSRGPARWRVYWGGSGPC